MNPHSEIIPITKVKKGEQHQTSDYLTVEEPLEIRLLYGPPEKRLRKSIAVTMRTPGFDELLAAGFLFAEGILENPDQVHQIRHLPTFMDNAFENIIEVELKPEVEINFQQLERHFYMTSSCGVCGKASIEAVQIDLPATFPQKKPDIAFDILQTLPEKLAKAQEAFQHTGGIHAAAIFTIEGHLIDLKEDVGRHNALDKLIGKAFLDKRLPLHHSILLVSGRASFELTQKALMAGIPLLAAVGAPSNLAVRLAKENGMAMVGFLKKDRMNVYTGTELLH